MSPRSLGLLTLAACQGGTASSAKETPEAPSRTVIELRDNGDLVARVAAGRPCRVMIAGDELIVGARPLVMMVGATRWAGTEIDGSIVITRDGESVARIHPTEVANDQIALFDSQGIALIRVSVTGDHATVRDRGQSPIRELRRMATAIGIVSGTREMTVTGTTDLILAAVLSAPEASTEVRALTACHRLLQKAAS